VRIPNAQPYEPIPPWVREERPPHNEHSPHSIRLGRPEGICHVHPRQHTHPRWAEQREARGARAQEAAPRPLAHTRQDGQNCKKGETGGGKETLGRLPLTVLFGCVKRLNVRSWRVTGGGARQAHECEIITMHSGRAAQRRRRAGKSMGAGLHLKEHEHVSESQFTCAQTRMMTGGGKRAKRPQQSTSRKNQNLVKCTGGTSLTYGCR
jgi:hypothetical protein